jgi:hypothetical protein
MNNHQTEMLINTFISFYEPTRELISAILADDDLHAKWINTLSYLENCGARMIAACEHPTLVKEEMLKHAAEEFRHAHHLKRQLAKLPIKPFETYTQEHILGGTASLHYLKKLNLDISRFLKRRSLTQDQIKKIAYLLVTYTIELRAGEVYAIYNALLKENRSKVSISSILLEEKEHLNEMIEGLHQEPFGLLYAKHACRVEATLYKTWLNQLLKGNFSG